MWNSLSQNLSVLPAPSGREPLARPQTLHLSRKLCRYAKGPISEGAVERSETGGVQARTLSVCSRWSQTAPPKGELIALPETFSIHPIRFSYRKKAPPSGELSPQATERVQPGAQTVWKTTVCVRFPHRVFLPGGLWKTAPGEIPDWRKANP